MTPLTVGLAGIVRGPASARRGRRRRWLAILGPAVLALSVAGCGRLDPTPEILDGLSVGAPARCGACDQPNTSDGCGPCESIRTIAVRHLDETWPDHAPVASWSFHGEGWYPGPSGEKMLHGRSGSLFVGVATLTDGTRHAVGIYCGVGGCH